MHGALDDRRWDKLAESRIDYDVIGINQREVCVRTHLDRSLARSKLLSVLRPPNSTDRYHMTSPPLGERLCPVQ